MNLQDFIAGKWQKGRGYQYFLPETINHSWELTDSRIQQKLEIVSLKLGELNSFAKFVPNMDLFIQSYVMKETVSSSRIEGTKTSIEEAFTDESDIHLECRDDWNETARYREALNFSMKELEKLPLSNRLLRATHRILLSHVRGKHKNPGEFRTSQNWIGGATLNDAVFVPPSIEHVGNLMSDLEKFLHNDEITLSPLVKIAMAHYQFETIHPFLDGNGRIGRLLIPLYLVSIGMLKKPLLYISDFFEKHKSLYYDNLTFVREKNDLIGWILFFLQGIETTCTGAMQLLYTILDLKKDLSEKCLRDLGRKSPQGQKLLEYLFQKPVTTIKKATEHIGLSPKATHDLVADFVRLGILEEITGNKRNRLFVFRKYLQVLKK